ncbi:MAG: YfjP family GTPase [Actinomycetota bacterium]|nr:YfjP family GTPase [Actinomycetota bacterium]
MASLLSRRRAAPVVGIDDRLHALADAVDTADGALPDGPLQPARNVVSRASARLDLGLASTVVALAGATGSGKSTLFNAMAGTELSAPGVRRPTTSTAHACVWGSEQVDPLLDWLQVPRRHHAGSDPELDGLILLDLPDHDSTERRHRAEVDRLVGVVDLLVWVLDPQKYADAAVHDRYLAPLASHAAVMLIVLNQVDRLSSEQREQCLTDLRRLLDSEGLGAVPIVATSARTGHGLADLRALLVERVASRRVSVERLSADVASAANGLASFCGPPAPGVGDDTRATVVRALAEVAGVDTVTRAVDRAYRARAVQRTGWPPLKWLRRLRPDPLRRLHLQDAGSELSRTSLPPPSAASRARTSSALRTLADTASDGLPAPWPVVVRGATAAEEPALPGRLDAAVAGTDLGMGRRPLWWSLFWLLQMAGILTALTGAVWLGGLFAWSYLQLGLLEPPMVGRLPLPTLLLIGGLLAGLVLALLARQLAAIGAARRARAARRRLTERVEQVAVAAVLTPVDAELDRYDRFCESVSRAQDA